MHAGIWVGSRRGDASMEVGFRYEVAREIVPTYIYPSYATFFYTQNRLSSGFNLRDLLIHFYISYFVHFQSSPTLSVYLCDFRHYKS